MVEVDCYEVHGAADGSTRFGRTLLWTRVMSLEGVSPAAPKVAGQHEFVVSTDEDDIAVVVGATVVATDRMDTAIVAGDVGRLAADPGGRLAWRRA